MYIYCQKVVTHTGDHLILVTTFSIGCYQYKGKNQYLTMTSHNIVWRTNELYLRTRDILHPIWRLVEMLFGLPSEAAQIHFAESAILLNVRGVPHGDIPFGPISCCIWQKKKLKVIKTLIFLGQHNEYK